MVLPRLSKSASIKALELSSYPRYNLASAAWKNSAYRSGCHKHFIFINLLLHSGLVSIIVDAFQGATCGTGQYPAAS